MLTSGSSGNSVQVGDRSTMQTTITFFWWGLVMLDIVAPDRDGCPIYRPGPSIRI